MFKRLADAALDWLFSVTPAEPLAHLPPHLRRPWSDAEVAIVALHMERVTPW